MVTEEMKILLLKIRDLCEQASDEVYENEDTAPILEQCDDLADKISGFLE